MRTPKPLLPATIQTFAILTVALAALACTRAPEESPAPPAIPVAGGAPSAPAAAKPAPTAASPDQNRALRELEAKLKPATPQPPPGTPAPPVASPTASPTATPSPPIANAEELKDGARKMLLQLASSLEQGDVKGATALCAEGKNLLLILKPSFHDILGDGVPSQNAAAIQHLMTGLRGKKWQPTVIIGELAQTTPQSPFVDGTIILKKSILRMESEGVSLEAHLDQLALIENEWKVFKLSAP